MFIGEVNFFESEKSVLMHNSYNESTIWIKDQKLLLRYEVCAFLNLDPLILR